VMPDIDLPPREWRSDRPTKEPFWGTGAVPAIAYIIGFSIMATAVYLLR
jgi:hypothetical protein